MDQLSTFYRIQELLKEKEKYVSSQKNLEFLKEKGEITLRQYEELSTDYTKKLKNIDEVLNTLKKELKEELLKMQEDKELLDEQIRKTQILALIGELPQEKAKNQIERLTRKIDSIEKKIHLYEAAIESDSYSKFQTRVDHKIYKKEEKPIKTLKNLRELLEEKEKQDNNLKNLEELYRKKEANKNEYENLKKEYLSKLEDIIDQIEAIRREIDLYIAKIKVEKEHLEKGIEELEVRIKVGEIDEKRGREAIERNIKQIKILEQHIFKLMKIIRANTPYQLEEIIEEEKDEEKKQKIEPENISHRKKKLKAYYLTLGILTILLIGFLLKSQFTLLNTGKESELSLVPYLMYLSTPEHAIDTFHLFAHEYTISTIKSIGERLMLPIGLKDNLLFIDEKGNIYLSSEKLDSITRVDSINSFIDCDPVYIGPYIILGDLDGNLLVFDSQNIRSKKRIKVEGAITAQPVSENGIVYILTETGNLYSFDVIKDSLIWHVKLQNGGRATPIISERYLYVLNMEGTLYKFDKTTGIKEGEVNLGEPCEASPIAYKGKIFVGTLWGNFYAITMDSLKIFYRINLSSSIRTSPSASYGTVIVGDLNGTCYAYSTMDTTLLWKYNTEGPNILGISIKDSVVIVANTNKLIALNLYSTGNIAKPLWERTIQNGIVSKPPFVYRGNIYLLTVDGKIILISPQKVPD